MMKPLKNIPAGVTVRGRVDYYNVLWDGEPPNHQKSVRFITEAHEAQNIVDLISRIAELEQKLYAECLVTEDQALRLGDLERQRDTLVELLKDVDVSHDNNGTDWLYSCRRSEDEWIVARDEALAKAEKAG